MRTSDRVETQACWESFEVALYPLFKIGMSSGEGGFKFSFGTAPSRKSEALPGQQTHNVAEEVLTADAQTVCPNMDASFFSISKYSNLIRASYSVFPPAA